MTKFVAQIKLVSCKSLVSGDREFEVKLRTADVAASELINMQGEKLVSVDIIEWNG